MQLDTDTAYTDTSATPAHLATIATINMMVGHSPKRAIPPRTADNNASDVDGNVSDGSVASLPNLGENQHNINTNRLKRKRENEFTVIQAEMRTMLANFETQQNNKLANLQATIMEIKTQNSDIQSAMEIMFTKQNEIQKELEGLRKERSDHLSYIKVLENKVETMERYSCAAKIELRNISSTLPSETKEDLINIASRVGTAIGVQVQKADIRDIYRGYAKPNMTKPIMVEFSSVLVKENMMKQLKKFNLKKANKDKLNSSHIQLQGPAEPIYISECATTKARKLYALARDFAKLNNITFCWISNGRVYLRQAEGKPCTRIDDDADIKKLSEKIMPQ